MGIPTLNLAAAGMCLVACVGGAAVGARVMGHGTQVLSGADLTADKSTDALYVMRWLLKCDEGKFMNILSYYADRCPARTSHSDKMGKSFEVGKQIRLCEGGKDCLATAWESIRAEWIHNGAFFDRIDLATRCNELTGSIPWIGMDVFNGPPIPKGGKSTRRIHVSDFCKAILPGNFDIKHIADDTTEHQQKIRDALIYANMVCKEGTT